MISKAALFAVCFSTTVYGFSPVSPRGTFGLRKIDASTKDLLKPTATSLYATIANSTDLLTPKTVPAKSATTVAAVPKLAQRWRKSTKQLATLGPASSTKEMIEKLFLAGADVFRLNFSHGSQEQKKELLLMIRVSLFLQSDSNIILRFVPFTH